MAITLRATRDGRIEVRLGLEVIGRGDTADVALSESVVTLDVAVQELSERRARSAVDDYKRREPV